jgi:hypothetical protein
MKLGCMVSQDGGTNEDVTNQINKARGALAQTYMDITPDP